jgi:pimeloyl-ACP methyl ester carboxylesterase
MLAPMQKFQRTTICFLLFLCLPSIWAAASLDGDWIGGFERPESRVFVHTHFWATNNETTGTIDVVDLSINTRATGKLPDVYSKLGYVPNTLLIGKPLNKLELTPSHVHFELADKACPLSFEGRVTNGVMTGMVQDSGTKLPFHLDLMARIDPSGYVGNYQVGPGHFIRIVPAPPVPFVLSFDTRSGQIRVLLPRSEADFVCGPEYDTFHPVDVAIHFITNQPGQFTALQWKPENAPAMVGTRIKALQEDEVSFTNGNVTLSGTVVLPPTKGPHPAVVIVNGSGSWDRSGSRFLADFFALNGVAALIYDKRGCGRSTGSWNESGFDDLAGDALAGLELLKNRQDINPHQIGLWGVSQGGWIVPLAASRCADVAFIISVSGPGITPEAQGAYCVEHWMKAAGYSEADVNEAGSLFLLTIRCRRTDSGWNELKAERKADQNKPWYDACPYLDRDATGASKFWQLIGNYDPVPALHKVHCPVLAIFGELDPAVPAQKSADIWKTALTEAGNHDVVIKIFPHADHAINDTRTWTTLPGFFTLQREWLLKHVTVNN